MTRRYVPISESMLSGPLGLLTEGRGHTFRVVDGLPVGARLVDADVDVTSGGTFAKYLSTLHSNGLVAKSGGDIVCGPALELVA